MKNADNTVELQEMATVNTGNHTHVADVIDWCASQINSLCPWQFTNDYLKVLNWFDGIVASQIGHPVKSYWLWTVEI